MKNRFFKSERKTSTFKKLAFSVSLILFFAAAPTLPTAHAFGPYDHPILNTFNLLISELQSFKLTPKLTLQQAPSEPSQPTVSANQLATNPASTNSNVASVVSALKAVLQTVIKPVTNLNLTSPSNNGGVDQLVKTKGLAVANLSRVDIQAMIDKSLKSITLPGVTQQVIYRSSPGSDIGLANAISQSFTTLRNDVSTGTLFDPNTITTLTNLTTASTSNFFGAGLGPCQSGNVLTYNGSGQFGCAPDATGGSSGGTKFATSTNQSTLYPNGGTNIGLVIGATATATPSLFEVTGGASIDRSTTTNATTTSFFTTTASSTNLFGAGLSTCNGASKGLTYDGAGKFGCATLSAASSTLLSDSNSFSALTFFSNILLTGSTTLQNFTFVNGTGTSATTTNFFATNASTTNLFYTTAKGGTETLTGTLTANNLLANASTTLQNFTFVNGTGTNATTTNFFATTASSTNLFYTTGKGGTETLTGTLAANNLLASASSTIGNNTTGGGLTINGGATTTGQALHLASTTLQNFTFVNGTGTSATTTNFFATTASSTSLFATSGNIGTLTAGPITSGLINNQTISSAANFTGTLTVTAGLTTLSNLVVTASSTIGNNTTGGGLTINGGATTTGQFLALGSTTLQNFTFVNGTGTNATTTNFFATNNLGTTETLTGLQTSGNLLVTGSSTLQNVTFINGTGTSATTTNFFATNASSTNFFFTTVTGGTLTVSGPVVFSGLAATTTAGQDVCYGQATGAVGNITHTNGTSACSASSRRFKQDINPLGDDSGLAEVMALNPVSFKYTNQYLGGFVNDPNWTKQFVGFIAEDVATVDPRLISVDDQGLPVNVQYPNITAILTKAVQEQQQMIQDLQTKIASLGVSVGNAIVNFAQVIADAVTTKKLTVGDSNNLQASGVTVLDRATGAPTCIFVESGVLRSATGECGAEPVAPQSNPTGGDPTPTPGSSPSSNESTSTATSSPSGDTGGNTGTTTATTTPTSN